MPTYEKASLGRFQGIVARGADDGLPPVLVVHGAFGQPVQLTPLLAALAEHGITTYALALRGHDQRTASELSGSGVLDYVRDVSEMVECMPARPILLGHSMGGLICEKAAETSRVAGLVLAAAAPVAPLMSTFKALPTWLRMMPRIMRGAVINPPRAEIATLAMVSSDAAARQAAVEELVPESGRAMRDMLIGAVRVDRAAIRCPVLSLFGDCDHIVPPWQMRGEARRLHARVIEYKGAGHFLIEAGWLDQIADDVANWIRATIAKQHMPVPQAIGA